ncbi:hypothetical protein AB1E19_015791 [Capra hircus]
MPARRRASLRATPSPRPRDEFVVIRGARAPGSGTLPARRVRETPTAGAPPGTGGSDATLGEPGRRGKGPGREQFRLRGGGARAGRAGGGAAGRFQTPGEGGDGGLGTRRMETDCNPMELSGVSGFEEEAELNGFEGTDMKDMRLEAEAVVNDVLFAVNTMFVSKTLRCADDVAYINVETRERNRYCLELTEAGLRVVGYAFDQMDDHLQTPYHETVYSLLDTLSPAYREAFGNALLQRLEALKREGQS